MTTEGKRGLTKLEVAQREINDDHHHERVWSLRS